MTLYCDYEGKGLGWVTAIKDIKKVRNLLVIMGLVMMKIISNFLVNVRSKNCCGYIVRAGQDGELTKNFLCLTKKLIDNFR